MNGQPMDGKISLARSSELWKCSLKREQQGLFMAHSQRVRSPQPLPPRKACCSWSRTCIRSLAKSCPLSFMYLRGPLLPMPSLSSETIQISMRSDRPAFPCSPRHPFRKSWTWPLWPTLRAFVQAFPLSISLTDSGLPWRSKRLS